ncbi:hypothetical protein DFH07DRAFT_1037118 [Mycena maculata]|uniref:Helicase C-terminal domain-containing protein n=1 Tax=Mycena maculata TaxID=230809 RepID=A0AAD7IPG5_9AGAR|nr:hypothetical protein DFH07DRAFT_1037118 [Mycena maculata]
MPHIVVTTPGRLNAHARDKALRTGQVRQTAGTAWRSEECATCSSLHGLQQHYMKLEETRKNKKLNELLDTLEFNQVVIFVKSVAWANELDKLLVSCNFPSISIHFGLAKRSGTYLIDVHYCIYSFHSISRYTAFKAFDKFMLVATDIFGCGIERVNISINYEYPPDVDSYLHHAGCAGRFGTKGLAVTFVSSNIDLQAMATIQSRFTATVPELPDHIDPASYIQYIVCSFSLPTCAYAAPATS